MANIQVRGVPDDVHQRLKSKAKQSGQSLNEFMLTGMTEMAGVPTLAELTEHIRTREPYIGPSSATFIREDRDRR